LLLHLEKFIAAHPELTFEQLDVLREFMGLLSLNPYRADSAFSPYVEESIGRIGARVLSTFEPSLARKILSEIGDSPVNTTSALDAIARPGSRSGRPPTSDTSRNLRPVGNPIIVDQDCDCRLEYPLNGCTWSPTNPWVRECQPKGCKANWPGCGYAFLETCTGMCGPD
jgi:hypothetical protein